MRTTAVGHVCIVGAGLAGLACALAAAIAGVQVDVFDESPGPVRLPAHVDVVPNLLRDLVGLGVADDCVKSGFPYRGVVVTDPSGRTCFELATERLAPTGYPEALGLAHGTFIDILARSAQAHGARLHWNARVHTVQLRDGAAVLHLAGGQSLVPDLALLATGARSPLRAAVFPAAQQGAADPGRDWTYALLPRPRGIDRAMLVIGHERQRAFVVPVSAAMLGVALSGAKEATFAHAALRPLLAHLDGTTQTIVRTGSALLLPPPWHRANLLCVGECAHALPPTFGQAAAQAVEDALVLKDLLVQGLAPDTLAERFSERRIPRARQVFDLVAKAARWQLLPDAGTDLQELSHRLSRLVATPA